MLASSIAGTAISLRKRETRSTDDLTARSYPCLGGIKIVRLVIVRLVALVPIRQISVTFGTRGRPSGYHSIIKLLHWGFSSLGRSNIASVMCTKIAYLSKRIDFRQYIRVRSWFGMLGFLFKETGHAAIDFFVMSSLLDVEI